MELFNKIFKERFFNKNYNKKRYYIYLYNICDFYSLDKVNSFKYYHNYLNEKYKEYLYRPYNENDFVKEEVIIWKNSSATILINYLKPKYYEKDKI